MPNMPPTFKPRGARTKADAARHYDANRRATTETRRLYSTARWQRLRAAQLADEPLCRFCTEAGVVTAATVCDHTEPHRGDVDRFWAGPFQSLCASCHNSTKHSLEMGGRGGGRGGVKSLEGDGD
jgi:5-methylcytosine-specific restriction protein A